MEEEYTLKHTEIEEYISKSVVDIARKCNVTDSVVIKTFISYARRIRTISE